LAVQLPMLTERTGAVMVYSDAIQIDSSGSVVYDFYIPPSQRHAPMLEEMLADLWNILPSSIVVPRWAIDLTAGFCEEFRGFFGEDTYFYLLLRQHGRFVYLDQPLLRYYRAGVEEQLGKRITLLRRVEGTADGADAISRTLANYEIFIRLVREQFGSRSTRLVRLTRRANSNQLVTMALAAMTSGDRALARRCCRLAIEQNPSNLKTYARYWWATMPPRLAVPLARLMPKRLLRSLAGPPFGWIA
ncbi:MAG TPA: hypothetical protein VNF29_08970, partial [Candidatus Binataceae bacterium]|nr:hypothetical protein [Candidatus Binataceae bacterium]